MISRFCVTNLFGYKKVDILFEDNIKILIGDNGLGKTTVLNSLYYLLNQKYAKLLKIDFESIEVEFLNKEKIVFSKFELESFMEYKRRDRNRRIPSSVYRMLAESDFSKLRQMSEKSSRITSKIEEEIIKFIKDNNIRKFAPLEVMSREIFRFITEPTFDVFNKLEKILKELNFTLLYLPTYRRVEEDLKNLGTFRKKINNPFDDEDFFEEVNEDIEITDDTLIHFGMEDVKRRIENIENEINKSTISGFSKVTGEMLSQLLRGFPNIDDKEIQKLDENTVKIILHRVGDNLPKHDRENILNLLEKKDSLKEKKELVYFIYKLIDIYNEHKHLDDAVKKFRDICNKYLSDKQFIYEESSVDLDIYRNNTTERVELNKLSSGEKQIISIFSKLYLDNNENLIVLFDEPELSLSLPWQEQLLPDIVDSNKCKFLLAVTHSPFIFDNCLEDYAVGMGVYVCEGLENE